MSILLRDTTTSTTHPAPPATSPPGRPVPGRPARLVRGRPDDPRWVRPALFGLLAATAVLYLVGLSASGYANQFYAAAAQAGTKSWEAFFFGSLDAGNSITVDKPPASLWLMALSARIFGFSSWSVLAPQALEGVAAVAVLYAAVRRRFSAGAGLLAGVILALTPVAVLMFRFDNPDALLVLVMTIAAYTTLRACENGRTRWLVATGALLGFGFLTKQLQAFLVLPGFAAAYLVAAPTTLRRRIVDLLWGGLALGVSAGWWIAAVELTPAADRPYIGGSTDNSILQLTFGYNGLGRITGSESGSTASQWGATGITRMFTSDFGGQISWLLPAALILLTAGFVMTGRKIRTNRARTSYLVWGSWLVVTGLTFSFMSGIIHPYYTVALAPAIAALVAIGSSQLWHRRAQLASRITMAGTLAVTAAWSWVLLDRSSSWLPWLRWTVVLTGAAATLGLLLVHLSRRRLAQTIAVVALASALAGPAAYAVQTTSTAHTGSIVSAGPTVSGGNGFGGGMRGGGRGGFTGGMPTGTGTWPQGTGTTGTAGTAGTAPNGTAPTGSFVGTTAPTRTAGGMTGTRTGGAGGLLDGATVGTALASALSTDAARYTWVAATVGAQNAASYELATGGSVMAIGGFNGTDNSPTLAQFKALVAEGKIHYFVPGNTSGGGTSTATTAGSAITSWVEATYRATTVGGTTVYDLTATSTTS